MQQDLSRLEVQREGLAGSALTEIYHCKQLFSQKHLHQSTNESIPFQIPSKHREEPAQQCFGSGCLGAIPYSCQLSPVEERCSLPAVQPDSCASP